MEEPFNEGAVQVRRLVMRDRKELMGNAADIIDKYKTEFGDGAESEFAASPAAASMPIRQTSTVAEPPAAAPAAAAPAAAPAAPSSSSPFAPSSSSPFAAGPGAAAASPFAAGPGAAASPFGAAPTRPSRLASIEPRGLTPDMGPDPIVAPPKDTRSWLARITLTQIVLFCSFSTIIGIMLATFWVVLNTGAVRLAGIE